jgi:hypothetical protein
MAGQSGDIIVGEEMERPVARPAAQDAPLFHHSLLCQLGLPRKRTDARIFERRSGAASLLMTAGHWYNGFDWVEQPLPYGSRPRLVLVNVITEAVRTRSRTVDVEHSVRGFLRKLGIDCGGNSMKGFKRQMIALACCHMQLGFRTDRGGGQVDTKPISRFEAWLVDEDQQRGLWPGELDLHADFFESVLEHAVPLDPLALAGLQNSAMALDVYFWLAHRLCRVTHAGGIVVSWRALKAQFGQEYVSLDEFRRSFIEAMGKVFVVYPDARVEVVRGGLQLLPSPPPVRKSTVLMPRIGKLIEAEKAEAPVESSKFISAATAMPPLEARTIELLRMLCPGWTIEQLWARYPYKSRKIDARDFDERFKNWAKQFGKYPPATEPLEPATAPTAPESTSSQLKTATLEAVREVAPGYDPAWLEGKFFEWNRSRGTTLRNPDKAFLKWAEAFTRGKKP